MAVTGHGGFNFARGVTVDGDLVLGGGEEDDAADLGEAESGADIEGTEDGLDGHGGGSEFADQGAEEFVDVLQSGASGCFLAFGGGAEGAVFEDCVLAAIAFDNAIARWAGGGGIQAENADVAVCGVGVIHGLVVYGDCGRRGRFFVVEKCGVVTTDRKNRIGVNFGNLAEMGRSMLRPYMRLRN